MTCLNNVKLFQITTSLASIHIDKRSIGFGISRGHGLLSGYSIHDALSCFPIHFGVQLEDDQNDGNRYVSFILCLRCCFTWVPI